MLFEKTRQKIEAKVTEPIEKAIGIALLALCISVMALLLALGKVMHRAV